MQTTIHQDAYLPKTATSITKPTLWKRLIQWAEGQEKNRFGWTAGILAGHGCVTTILTVFAILLTGNQFIFWPIAIGAMAACVITNLAAMPTKITIPVFFVSLLVDLIIITICLINGFDVNATSV
jgi:hypothetical protein